ncbi:MAG: 30S ribosomal protein S3 [Deltaproteobacteria bacterium]
MGHKVHPFVQRVGFIRTWHSRWFANPKEFSKLIQEDQKMRKFIMGRFRQAAISKIIIERLTEKIKVRISSARPGLIIGRHGSDIEKLRADLNDLVKKEITIDIDEVKDAGTDAQLIAQNIVFQIEKRVAFRRAVKRAMEQAMMMGVKGVKIRAAGRLDGAEMCRRETYKQGKVPLQTLRADIEYGFAEAYTTYGLIGIKVWTYKGEILEKRERKVPAAAQVAVSAAASPEAKQ